MATPRPRNQNEIQKNQRGGKRPGAGRPRGRVDIATADQKDGIEAKAREYTGTAIQALVDIATTGKSEPARVTAATALLDRGYGKPRQAVEHSGPAGGPISVQLWKFGKREVAF